MPESNSESWASAFCFLQFSESAPVQDQSRVVAVTSPSTFFVSVALRSERLLETATSASFPFRGLSSGSTRTTGTVARLTAESFQLFQPEPPTSRPDHVFDGFVSFLHSFADAYFTRGSSVFSAVSLSLRGCEIEAREGRPALLDFLYDSIEDPLLDGNFGLVDQWLMTLPIEQLSETFLVGVLAITLPFAAKLSQRPGFVARASEKLLADHGPSRRDALIAGLE